MLVVYFWAGDTRADKSAPEDVRRSTTSRRSKYERRRNDKRRKTKTLSTISIARKDQFTPPRKFRLGFDNNLKFMSRTRSEFLKLVHWHALIRVCRKLVPRLASCVSKAKQFRDVLAFLGNNLRSAYRTAVGQHRFISFEKLSVVKRKALALESLANVATSLRSRSLLSNWRDIKTKDLVTRLPRARILLARLSKVRDHVASSRWSKFGERRLASTVGHQNVIVKKIIRQIVHLSRGRRMRKQVEVVVEYGRHDDVIKQYNTRMALYRKIPLKSVSRFWGWCNQRELPTWLRGPALGLYVWLFGCDLSEALQQDLRAYRNLCELFQRTLRSGVRPIDYSYSITSPADGRVLYCSRVVNDALEQVKGVTYSLKAFLGSPDSDAHQDDGSTANCSRHLLINPGNVLYQCIVYLAPGDYHHFHSPADWTVEKRRHFPGELFSVNPSVARWLQGLFCLNERAVYTGRWEHGFFAMTAVGATNVGSISVSFDKNLATNTSSRWPTGYHSDVDFTSDVRMNRGDSFGKFNLGSTIVLLFEAPTSFRFDISPGERVSYGQGMGRVYEEINTDINTSILTYIARSQRQPEYLAELLTEKKLRFCAHLRAELCAHLQAELGLLCR